MFQKCIEGEWVIPFAKIPEVNDTIIFVRYISVIKLSNQQEIINTKDEDKFKTLLKLSRQCNDIINEMLKDKMENNEDIDHQFGIVIQYYSFMDTPQAVILKEITKIYLEISEGISLKKLTIGLYSSISGYDNTNLKVSSQ